MPVTMPAGRAPTVPVTGTLGTLMVLLKRLPATVTRVVVSSLPLELRVVVLPASTGLAPT